MLSVGLVRVRFDELLREVLYMRVEAICPRRFGAVETIFITMGAYACDVEFVLPTTLTVKNMVDRGRRVELDGRDTMFGDEGFELSTECMRPSSLDTVDEAEAYSGRNTV